MEYKLLFVDDNQKILNEYAQLLTPFSNKWQGYFARNAKEALDILKTNEIDACLVDYIMPELNGIELLSRIKKNYPKVLRILLASDKDEKLSIRNFNLAHQFLLKPDNFESIRIKLELPLILKNLITNERTLIKLNGEDGIPSLPEIYYKIEKEIFSPEASIHRVVNLIAKDIALTTKIFQLVNSAFVGIAAKITDLHQAINILGLNVVKSVILYEKVFSHLDKKEGLKEIIETIWNHSLVVSTLSHKLTYHFTQKRELAEEAYIAGILHDIGKIILMNIEQNHSKVLEFFNNSASINDEDVKKYYGASHSELGAYALSLWGFSKEIVEAILLHHGTPTINDFNVTSAVQISNKLANIEGIDDSIYDTIYTKDGLIELLNGHEEKVENA